MCSMTVIKLSLFLSLQCCLRLAKSESILIIALPQSDTKVSASWERGEEILPGALAAIEEAKNSTFSFNLTLIIATSGAVTRYDLPYSGDMLEIIANLTWQKRASDIIAIAGVLHPNILAALKKFQLPTASLVHFNKTPLNNSVHYMTASISTLTDSILEFLKEINPNKIGIMTEFNQPYYLTVSNELSTKANVSLYSQIISKHHTSLSDIAERVLASNVHTILLSVSPSTAVPMLCEAYKRGLTWPKYAWILHSYRLDDLLQSFTSNRRCSNQKILEGVFIFQLTKEGSSFDSETIYRNFSNGELNPYAYLLHDSVWALISSAGNKSGFQFNKTPSPFHFKSDNSAKVYVYQNMNSKASLIGIYSGTSHIFAKVNETIIFADYDLPIVNKEAFLVYYLLPLPILSCIFNTILLILYIVFRNEPSIKSTSVSLSMLIFIGCYILVGYSACLMVVEPDFCMALIWLSGVGLSVPLILATILVKMLRVYHIFTAHKILKQRVHSSDCALFLYTILIISPNITLLTLWTAIDRPHTINSVIEHPGFIEVKITCHYSNYGNIWFAPAFAYIFLLSVAVIIVAIKSRKIRLAQFKDTKQVNLLIFLLYLVGICMFSYWKILLHSGFVIPSVIILYAGHILMAFLCQIILFVPKIWLAIRQR